MKTLLLYVLGLLLAGMAFTGIRAAISDGWDIIELGIAAAFLAGAIGAFRAGAGVMDNTKPPAEGPGAGA
ncbi:hypothetical protein [Streptomyces sp. NPDC010273]|uniref:hypothetical protein n=1 Tax=Streptomyces sp. NPDC010273 TaxID=3364829 RepID=UPI0036E9C5F1